MPEMQGKILGAGQTKRNRPKRLAKNKTKLTWAAE